MNAKVLGISIAVIMFLVGLLAANPQAIGAPPENNPGQPFDAILQKLDELFASSQDHLPPAGVDLFPVVVELELDLGPLGEGIVPLVGEVIVDRSEPDTTRVVQTEILSMSLSGSSPSLGDVTLKAGREFGLPPSPGIITPLDPSSDFPALATFDVFFEVEVQGLQLQNIEPLKLETQSPIREIPPLESLLTPVRGVPLIGPDGAPAGTIGEESVFVPTIPSQAIIKAEIIDLKKDLKEIKDKLDDIGGGGTGPVCGNGICELGENIFTCPLDCSLPPPPICGNGICELGEDERVCPQDCGGESCGDGVCDPSIGENVFTCSVDCFCGDGICEPIEEPFCIADCHVP